jgi:hypothetical protein
MSMTGESRTGRFVAVVLVLAVAIAIPLVLWLRSDSSNKEDARVAQGGTAPNLAEDAPFPGTRVSLDEAKQALRYNVVLPDSSGANDGTITSVWLQEQSQKLGVVYGDSDISLVMEPTDFTDGGAARFSQYVKSGIAESEVRSVGDQQILVVFPGTDALGSNPSYVEIVWNGLDISLFSKVESPDVLLEAVAGLLHQGQSSQSPSV